MTQLYEQKIELEESITTLYEKRFDEDAEISIILSDKKDKYCWSPELFNHRSWILKVADVSGFAQKMLKTGDDFTLCKNGSHYLFCCDKAEPFIINTMTCKTLIDNSVKV